MPLHLSCFSLVPAQQSQICTVAMKFYTADVIYHQTTNDGNPKLQANIEKISLICARLLVVTRQSIIHVRGVFSGVLCGVLWLLGVNFEAVTALRLATL